MARTRRRSASLPPMAEWMRGLTSVEQRLALLAAALGVPGLVVNDNLTQEQCSNNHRIVEAVAPWVGINQTPSGAASRPS